VNQVCQSLYEEAGKCESPYGFVGMANDEEDYSTQLSNENEVCEFISNIKAGEYDQRGEIVLTGITTYASAVSSLSDGQIFALTFFAVGSVGLVLYAVYLRRKIVANQKNALVEL
jgi:predicted RND superfamily exporter protein